MSEKKKCCADMVSRKLKVLMIHGYRQNAEVFRQKTGSFRKMIHKWVDFTYVTAPHKVVVVPDLSNPDDTDIQQSTDEEQYGWFFNRDDKTFRGIRKGGPAIGFEESIQFIEDVFEKAGPFDGVLGFSQGGCFLGLLCDMQHRGLTKCRFKFAVFVSAFKSGSLAHSNYYTELMHLPTLHIFGENDQIIPTVMSRELSGCFEDEFVVTHPGGHYLPAASPQKHKYQKFFKTMWQELCEDIEEVKDDGEEETLNGKKVTDAEGTSNDKKEINGVET